MSTSSFESPAHLEAEQSAPITEVRRKPKLMAENPSDRIAFEARKLDDSFARILVTRSVGSLEQIHKDLDTLEILGSGKQVVDDKTRTVELQGRFNQTDVIEYVPATPSAEGAPPLEAIRKGTWGEVLFAFEAGKLVMIARSIDQSGKLVEQSLPFDENDEDQREMIEYFTNRLNNLGNTLESLAYEYEIAPDEVPLSSERFLFKAGFDVGQPARSELTVSRIDRLCGLNVVPLTTLRSEKHGLASVQEKADARLTRPHDFRRALKLDADHPMAKSLIRIACLDYLVGSGDRHEKNLMFNKKTQEFIAIDNGYSLGFSRDTQVNHLDKATGEIVSSNVQNAPMEGLISVPIELMEKRGDWQLDDESWQAMKSLYDELYASAQSRVGKMSVDEEKDMISPIATGGEAAKFLSELFRFQFQNEKVADKEIGHFLERLRYLIENRRPPAMRDRQDFLLRQPELQE